MNAVFLGFLLWITISNHYIRMMIKDTYRYKKTHRQVREFENWYFRGKQKLSIFLPYRELAKDCNAPRHLKAFQIMRIINWCIIAVGILCVIFYDLSWSKPICAGVNLYSILNFITVWGYSMMKKPKADSKNRNCVTIDLDRCINP